MAVLSNSSIDLFLQNFCNAQFRTIVVSGLRNHDFEINATSETLKHTHTVHDGLNMTVRRSACFELFKYNIKLCKSVYKRPSPQVRLVTKFKRD